jgi:serine/threonine protein kinase
MFTANNKPAGQQIEASTLPAISDAGILEIMKISQEMLEVEEEIAKLEKEERYEDINKEMKKLQIDLGRLHIRLEPYKKVWNATSLPADVVRLPLQNMWQLVSSNINPFLDSAGKSECIAARMKSYFHMLDNLSKSWSVQLIKDIHGSALQGGELMAELKPDTNKTIHVMKSFPDNYESYKDSYILVKGTSTGPIKKPTKIKYIKPDGQIEDVSIKNDKKFLEKLDEMRNKNQQEKSGETGETEKITLSIEQANKLIPKKQGHHNLTINKLAELIKLIENCNTSIQTLDEDEDEEVKKEEKIMAIADFIREANELQPFSVDADAQILIIANQLLLKNGFPLAVFNETAHDGASNDLSNIIKKGMEESEKYAKQAEAQQESIKKAMIAAAQLPTIKELLAEMHEQYTRSLNANAAPSGNGSFNTVNFGTLDGVSITRSAQENSENKAEAPLGIAKSQALATINSRELSKKVKASQELLRENKVESFFIATLLHYSKATKFAERAQSDLWNFLNDPSTPKDKETIKKFAGQIVLAIYALHSANIVHRDIKLLNILVYKNKETNNYRLCLADLDELAKVNDDGTPVGKPGAIGTEGYLAPEATIERQQNNITEINLKAADCYAVGITLAQLFETLLKRGLQSNQTILLITSLLHNDPNQRLTMDALKNSEYFGASDKEREQFFANLEAEARQELYADSFLVRPNPEAGDAFNLLPGKLKDAHLGAEKFDNQSAHFSQMINLKELKKSNVDQDISVENFERSNEEIGIIFGQLMVTKDTAMQAIDSALQDVKLAVAHLQLELLKKTITEKFDSAVKLLFPDTKKGKEIFAVAIKHYERIKISEMEQKHQAEVGGNGQNPGKKTVAAVKPEKATMKDEVMEQYLKNKGVKGEVITAIYDQAAKIHSTLAEKRAELSKNNKDNHPDKEMKNFEMVFDLKKALLDKAAAEISRTLPKNTSTQIADIRRALVVAVKNADRIPVAAREQQVNAVEMIALKQNIAALREQLGHSKPTSNIAGAAVSTAAIISVIGAPSVVAEQNSIKISNVTTATAVPPPVQKRSKDVGFFPKPSAPKPVELEPIDPKQDAKVSPADQVGRRSPSGGS